MLTNIKTLKVANTIIKKLFICLPRAMNIRGADQPVIERLIKPRLDNRSSPSVNFITVNFIHVDSLVLMLGPLHYLPGPVYLVHSDL